jgi:hypothetical protein
MVAAAQVVLATLQATEAPELILAGVAAGLLLLQAAVRALAALARQVGSLLVTYLRSLWRPPRVL